VWALLLLLLSAKFPHAAGALLAGALHVEFVYMDPLRELGRGLLILGGIVVVVGAFLYFSGWLPLRLGRLPGDIVHRGEHTTFYFPVVTCLILSIGLSLVFWLFSHFRR
jgi:Protein of unknown function (DUF2905)